MGCLSLHQGMPSQPYRNEVPVVNMYALLMIFGAPDQRPQEPPALTEAPLRHRIAGPDRRLGT